LPSAQDLVGMDPSWGSPSLGFGATLVPLVVVG